MLILRNSLKRYRASKSIANLPKCEHPWSLASQCFARFDITSSWRKQREGSGSGWKRVLSHYWGARLGRSARDRKKEKRNEKEGREEGDAAGENGSCCCLSPFEKSRETAETFFFCFRLKNHRENQASPVVETFTVPRRSQAEVRAGTQISAPTSAILLARPLARHYGVFLANIEFRFN